MLDLATLLMLILAVGYCALHLFYFVGWKKSREFSSASGFVSKNFISVIVVARNEEDRIINCVQSILRQTYHQDQFEVIVVNDHSTDGTETILAEIKHPNLQQINLSETRSSAYKKEAIAKAIKQAKGSLIVTTDADCVVPPNWLKTIEAFYQKTGAKMIAAPVVFESHNSWMSTLQELDLIGLQGITAGSMTNGIPAMCNGANLAFEKSAFYEVEGYAGIDDVPTGDDVLLMMKIKDRFSDGVRFLKSKKAIVTTFPLERWDELWQQRLRWVSKSSKFQDKRVTATLVLAYLFYLSIAVNLLLGLFNPQFFLIGVGGLIIKALCELPLLLASAKFFDRSKLLKYALFAQPFHLVYALAIGVAAQFIAYEWKGREYKIIVVKKYSL